MSVKLKPKSPVTDFLHHKVIVSYGAKTKSIYEGLEGRVIATKVMGEGTKRQLTLYQIHFAKSEMKGKEHLNDLWFTDKQFRLTR